MRTTMRATVLSAQNCRMSVCDQSTSQEVVVHSPCACHFRAGDQVCITYSGAMTMSIPPQNIAHPITGLLPSLCSRIMRCAGG